MPQFLAFDLGASSGRAVLGTLTAGSLDLQEVHRFDNGPVAARDTLYTDILRLWTEVMEGLRAVESDALDGIGVDTWGVDFGLLDERGALLGNPVHYRDARTDGMMERAFQRVARRDIFEHTGIQFMQLNSVFQLYSMVVNDDPALRLADRLLFTPDLLNYWLTGRAVNEFSIASTSQCYNMRARAWAAEMLEALDIPMHIFGEVVPTGAVLGPLDADVPRFKGRVPVIASASHDTAAAVAAVPATGEDFVYISSGTWSLMGAEVREPVVTDRCLEYNFTNEGGVNNSIRLLKNIAGLWLVQECRRVWAEAGTEYSYAELTEMASGAPAFGPVVDPDSADFFAPGDMPARIRAFCARTGQPEPADEGAVVRCALESLALKYRRTLENLEALLGRTMGVIHIIGGGSKNALLCRLTADATGRRVVAGPDEATAIGNIIVQAMATGCLESLAAGRELVSLACDLRTYEPDPATAGAWDGAYRRFGDVLGV
ncbi:MAG: rhamnulokinase [Anaerolineae bacterium]|nr:rhamnulokinase [Anaerolineae bacterium]